MRFERENGANLFTQLSGVKGFHHVVGDASLSGFSDVTLIAPSGNHQEGNVAGFLGTSQGAKQIHAGHPGHVPVRNNQSKSTRRFGSSSLEHFPSQIPVLGLMNFFESQLFQHSTQDASHRGHVIDDQDLQRQVQTHLHKDTRQ